ncbi:XisI protein [Desulfococcaceae bacterium HSG8]|nr:XisI protein [Desulfococcaceae bacterium HSG8]
MDKSGRYRNIVRDLLTRHAEHFPHHGEIRTLPVSDEKNDNYLLMDIGWDRTGRVHTVAFHVHINNEKIWIEWDGTENGITDELLAAGVPREDIVLGFYRPGRRAITGFAVE